MPPENQQYPGAPQPPLNNGAPVAPQQGQPGYPPASPAPQPGQPAQQSAVQQPAQPPAAPQQQPQQPQGPAQPYEFPARPREKEENPYDFFMESQRSSQRMPSFDASPAKKLLMIVGLVAVVMGLLAIILAIAAKPSGSSTALLTIAQEQSEMIRVAGDAAKNSHSDTIQNFSATLQVGLSSAQIELTTYMAKTGTKTNDTILALGHSAKTDQALSAAQAADTYDTTYESIMRSSLNRYLNDLTQESSAATTKTEQQIIQKDIDGATLLQKMLPQPAQ